MVGVVDILTDMTIFWAISTHISVSSWQIELRSRLFFRQGGSVESGVYLFLLDFSSLAQCNMYFPHLLLSQNNPDNPIAPLDSSVIYDLQWKYEIMGNKRICTILLIWEICFSSWTVIVDQLVKERHVSAMNCSIIASRIRELTC